MKSSKKYITEYIILKILNEDFKINDIVSSENKLAIKFNCSRLTSRSALTNLVSVGILESFKGFGYKVSNKALDILFFAKSINKDMPKSKISKINELKINHKSIQIELNACEIFLIKNINEKNIMTSMSFLIINKDFFQKYFKADYNIGTKNPIEDIIKMAFIPSLVKTNYILLELNHFDEELKSLGYECNKQIPIIDQTLFDENGVFAIKTLNILNKEEMLYSFINNIFNINNIL